MEINTYFHWHHETDHFWKFFILTVKLCCNLYLVNSDLLVSSKSMNDSHIYLWQLLSLDFKMNKLLLLYHTFPIFSYGIFNNGIKYVPMGYKEASCPPNIPTKTQTGGGNILVCVNYFFIKQYKVNTYNFLFLKSFYNTSINILRIWGLAVLNIYGFDIYNSGKYC